MTNPKVAYVLGQKQTRLHHCHWPGCEEQVPPARWGCRKHWYALPKAIRDRIWGAFVPGQEKTLRPNSEYVAAAKEAQAWIMENSVDTAPSLDL